MLRDLQAKFACDGCLVAGVLSGTSGDGIDVAIARVRVDESAPGEQRDGHLPRGLATRRPRIERPELLAYETISFPKSVSGRVRAVLDGAPTSLRESALLSRDLGRAFGQAAREVAARQGLVLDLVGSHGQTAYHHDGAEESGPATLQIGDGDFVAEECRCTVVSDFRQRDIAAGGEGAPLSALADGTIFGHVERPCAILNLGGMGNLSILGRENGDLLAFDTGPANSLLDGLARALFDEPFDRDGAHAARGTANERLIQELLQHPFFTKRPPRSTGRDTFGQGWVASVIERADARASSHESARTREDLMATAVAFVAETVADSLARFAPHSIERLIVAGGGVHNHALMKALEQRVRASVAASDTVGVSADAREGLVFALLATAGVMGIPLSNPRATGAMSGRVLGKISLPPTV